jgi:hypothetical protein
VADQPVTQALAAEMVRHDTVGPHAAQVEAAQMLT